MSVKQHTLCDFALAEVLHDFGGKAIPNTDPGPNNIHMLTAKRFNKNTEIFSKLLRVGLPNCDKKFTNYNEDKLLALILGKTFKSDINNKKLHDKEITTINGNKYHVSIADKKDPKYKKDNGNSKNNEEEDVDNYKDNFGELFFEDLNFGKYSETKTPVILADTYSWVYDLLKQGNRSDNKAYIYSPLVVLADSASKPNLTDPKKMIPFFVNDSGVTLVNVIDEDSFQTSKFEFPPPPENVLSFFSKYQIATFKEDNSINQIWSGLLYQGGNNTSVKRINVGDVNNKRYTFTRMSQLINDEKNPSEQNNFRSLDRLVKDSPESKKNAELANIEFQSKRSGDWLPVIYILNYEKIKTNITLITYSDPRPDKRKDLDEETKRDVFNKNNMYILTVDRPLVAFALYCGVNVLYITFHGQLVKFEADPKNPSVYNV